MGQGLRRGGGWGQPEISEAVTGLGRFNKGSYNFAKKLSPLKKLLETHKLDILGVTEAEIYPDSMCKNTGIISRTL